MRVWYWLVDGLIEHGYPVHLANTLAIQQYNGIKYTTDETDAHYLAHLLRHGILPTGYSYPKAMRHVRGLLRRPAAAGEATHRAVTQPTKPDRSSYRPAQA